MRAEIKEIGRAVPARLGNRKGGGRYAWAIFPVLLCAFAGRTFSGWVYAWVVAGAIYAAAKWMVLADFPETETVAPWKLFVFLFLWPGMNLRKFLFGKAIGPGWSEWLAAAGKTVLGAVIIWGGLRFFPASEPLLTGWVGMVGLAFLLHFGLFHLSSNVWRSMRFDAGPIMANPVGATSLAGFWGRRWNKAFNDLMVPYVFHPLDRRAGHTFATLGVFLVSGVLHEAVISLPAKGGFGLPTVYFGCQAAGLLFERSEMGGRIGLGRGWRGWLWTAMVTGGPACLLFHPCFIRNVVLPMMRSIGAF